MSSRSEDHQRFQSTSSEEEAKTSSDKEHPTMHHDTVEKAKIKRRGGALPKESVKILRKWLNKHKFDAYPTEVEKANLCRETKLTDVQVSNWFINARRRYLPKMMSREGYDYRDYTKRRRRVCEVNEQAVYEKGSKKMRIDEGSEDCQFDYDENCKGEEVDENAQLQYEVKEQAYEVKEQAYEVKEQAYEVKEQAYEEEAQEWKIEQYVIEEGQYWVLFEDVLLDEATLEDNVNEVTIEEEVALEYGGIIEEKEQKEGCVETQKMIDEDDSEYRSIVDPSTVESAEKSIKEVILVSKSKTADGPAREVSMAILSPVLPAEVTLEAEVSSETSKLQGFKIRVPPIENSNNQTKTTQRPSPGPSEVTSSTESAQKENNTHLSASNGHKTCEQNQLQARSTFSQQQTTLKRSSSVLDQMQYRNKRQHHNLRQQQSISLQQQQQQSISVDHHDQRPLHLGEQQSLNLIQNPPQENLSLLHQPIQSSNQQFNQPQPNFAVSPQVPSHPPQEIQMISHSRCADILLHQLLAYLKWFQGVCKAFGIPSTSNVFDTSSLTFKKYYKQTMLDFGKRIIMYFLPFDVDRLNIAEIFNIVSEKLIEKGHQIGTNVALGITSHLIKPCQAICKTPFTKLFYNYVTAMSDYLEAKSTTSRLKNAWNVANLEQLKTQIQQCNWIANWFSTTNTGNENNSREISAYAEPLPTVQSSQEPETTTDGVIDLTSIDENDILECQEFLL